MYECYWPGHRRRLLRVHTCVSQDWLATRGGPRRHTRTPTLPSTWCFLFQMSDSTSQEQKRRKEEHISSTVEASAFNLASHLCKVRPTLANSRRSICAFCRMIRSTRALVLGSIWNKTRKRTVFRHLCVGVDKKRLANFFSRKKQTNCRFAQS